MSEFENFQAIVRSSYTQREMDEIEPRVREDLCDAQAGLVQVRNALAAIEAGEPGGEMGRAMLREHGRRMALRDLRRLRVEEWAS